MWGNTGRSPKTTERQTEVWLALCHLAGWNCRGDPKPEPLAESSPNSPPTETDCKMNAVVFITLGVILLTSVIFGVTSQRPFQMWHGQIYSFGP